jgi:hypothetical protein
MRKGGSEVHAEGRHALCRPGQMDARPCGAFETGREL